MPGIENSLQPLGWSVANKSGDLQFTDLAE